MAKFITFEGVDGAGKSTHLNWFADTLRARGIDLLVTREPGGTPLGEKLREILLHEPMHAETEALLMFAARREHLAQVIKPALERGTWVISDRFTDASFAYQGGGRGVVVEKLEQLERWVQEDLQPDLTLLFDIPVEVARERLTKNVALTNVALDKFEQEKSDFFNKVRNAYLARAQKNPARFAIIHAEKSPGEVKASLEKIVTSV
ncbi:MAG: dTMP kinase [Gallionellales bacterium 35-53-114]|jgi:dTMP kinase|nr:MAG: dTMP kinase [Gallionellales bacterium 35-53-114]OYZ63041.1 MAG: dTMP kinase [Gallionellales bacterium 24-53-125]OZB08977.1 MAG: dTMP kinase [Gallionellales bacterium 39-52-133]